MGLLPSKPDLSSDADAAPRVVGVDSEDADALMSALTSRTARRLLSSLHEEPAPPSGLAEQVDTSLQNVQYHLERLEDAGAVEVIGTAYSEKGREMDVYAPADEPLVIYAGREEEATGLRAALSRLVGGVAALAVGAVAVQETFGEGPLFPAVGTGGDAGGAGGGDADGIGGSGGAGGGDGADAGSAGTPEPTGTPDGGVGIAEAPEGTPTPAAEPTATPAGETVETTETVASAATGTPAPTPEGTPSPMATEAATPVPTEATTATPGPEPTPAATAADLATETARTVAEAGGGGGLEPAALPPGLLFFLGGALVLVAAVALTYGR